MDVTEVPDDSQDFCAQLEFFTKIIYVLTGSCKVDRSDVIEALAPVSELSGYLSIIAWLFAQLPQVIKNYNDKSVEGLSLAFLGCWFAGDMLNFVSCIMSEALPFQTLLSGYYIIIDFVLAGQYYYYSRVYDRSKDYTRRLKRNQRLRGMKSPNTALRERLLARKNGGPIGEIDADAKSPGTIPVPVAHIPSSQRAVRPSSFAKLVSSSFIMGFSRANSLPINMTEVPGRQSAIDQIIGFIVHTVKHMDRKGLGKLLAWMCTFLYLSSRIPQIRTNYKLRTTKGVSLKLFVAAISGNLLYATSLCTCEAALVGGDESSQFWAQEISYLVGSVGTVMFDLIVLLQWYMWDYGRLSHRTRSGKLLSPSQVPLVSTSMAPMMIKSPLTNKSQLARSLGSSLAKSDCKPIVILSPKHARKLSTLTPLSPIDFLIEDMMGPSKGSVMSNNSSKLNVRAKKWAETATVIIGDDDNEQNSIDETTHLRHSLRQTSPKPREDYGSIAFHDHFD